MSKRRQFESNEFLALLAQAIAQGVVIALASMDDERKADAEELHAAAEAAKAELLARENRAHYTGGVDMASGQDNSVKTTVMQPCQAGKQTFMESQAAKAAESGKYSGVVHFGESRHEAITKCTARIPVYDAVVALLREQKDEIARSGRSLSWRELTISAEAVQELSPTELNAAGYAFAYNRIKELLATVEGWRSENTKEYNSLNIPT